MEGQEAGLLGVIFWRGTRALVPSILFFFRGCSKQASPLSTTCSRGDGVYCSGPNQQVQGSWDEISELEPEINQSSFMLVGYLRYFAPAVER